MGVVWVVEFTEIKLKYPHWVARYVIVHLPPALSSLLHAYSSTKLPDLMPLLLARGETLWDNEFSLVYKKKTLHCQLSLTIFGTTF